MRTRSAPGIGTPDVNSCRATARPGAAAAHRAERGAAWPPAERVGHTSRGRREASHVRRHVIRLHHVLGIGNADVAPLADLDVQLAVILIRALLVPGEQAEDRRGIEPRRIADAECVGAIAERSGQDDLGARPAPVPLRQLEVEGAVCLGPGVRGIVVIVPAAIAGFVPDLPFVSAEREGLSGARGVAARASWTRPPARGLPAPGRSSVVAGGRYSGSTNSAAYSVPR